MKLTIYSDGGSRGNPGPSALGIVIKNKDGKTLKVYGKYLGEQTNNYSEYMALISGLQTAKKLKADEIECIVDSKLVCEQIKGNWKIKEITLQKLFVKAYNLIQQFKTFKITHILRVGNKEADFEVNKVLNKIVKKS